VIQELANRIHGQPNWPPKGIKEKWEEIEGYRRRLENDWDEMLKYTPYFSGSAERTAVYTPVPVVREIAAFSADLMFSEAANITHEEATLQEALDLILESNGFSPFLQDAAQAIAVEGRGGLRVQWDDDLPLVTPVPVIDYIPEDHIIWEMKYKRFVISGTVVIERTDDRDRNVYRLFEKHERGKVTRTLFRGSGSMLGREVPLTSFEEFAHFEPEVQTGLDALTLIRWDNVPGGRSDITGMDTLLDRINEEYSRGTLKSRRSNPITFADRTLADEGGRINMDGIQLTGGGTLLDAEGGKQLVQTVQPDVRAEAQIMWIDYLLDSGLLFMGYSKASYGRDEGGSADSGKALKLRQARTLLKRAGKERMAREAIQTALSVATAMLVGSASVQDLKPKVELADGLPTDEVEVSQGVATAMGAGAMSVETAVRTLHPDWSDDEILEEVDRIAQAAQADQIDQAIGRAMPGSGAVDGEAQSPGDQQGGSTASADTEVTCTNCGYKWTPRAGMPQRCPNCGEPYTGG
jgi:hypothetical protein